MKPTNIVIHHSGTSLTTSATEFDQYYKNKNYPQSKLGKYAPFHYSIDYNGQIFQHRKNLETGFQIENHPDIKTIDIALIGNFDTDSPLKNQASALIKLIKDLKEKWGSLPVYLYREMVTDSKNPGKNISREWLDKILSQGLKKPQALIEAENERDRYKDLIKAIQKEKNDLASQFVKQTRQVKNLEIQLLKTREELAESLKKRGEYESQNQTVQKQLNNNRQDLENMLRLTGEREAEIDLIQKQLKDKKQELENVLRLVGRKEADSVSFRTQLRNTKNELENILKLAGKREVEINDLRVKVIKRERKIKHLKLQLVAARKEAIEFKKKYINLREKTKKDPFVKKIKRLFSKAKKEEKE